MCGANTLMVEAIEAAITAMPEGERNARWVVWWDAHSSSEPTLRVAGLAAHRVLYRRYRQATERAPVWS